jgi:hypothetical protein
MPIAFERPKMNLHLNFPGYKQYLSNPIVDSSIPLAAGFLKTIVPAMPIATAHSPSVLKTIIAVPNLCPIAMPGYNYSIPDYNH